MKIQCDIHHDVGLCGSVNEQLDNPGGQMPNNSLPNDLSWLTYLNVYESYDIQVCYTNHLDKEAKRMSTIRVSYNRLLPQSSFRSL